MEENRQEKSVSSRKPLMFLAGAIVGGAIAHFLNTPKGRQLTKDFVDRSVSLSNDVRTSAEQAYTTVKDQAAATAEKARSTMDAIVEKASATGSYIGEKSRDKAVSHLESLENGIASAKKKLANVTVQS